MATTTTQASVGAYKYSRGHVYTMPCAAYFVQCSCDSFDPFDRQARLTENCLKSFIALDVEMESENRQGLIQITVCLGHGQTGRQAGRQAGALDSNRRCRTGLCCIMALLCHPTYPHLPAAPATASFHVPGAFNERIFHLSEHCEVISK